MGAEQLWLGSWTWHAITPPCLAVLAIDGRGHGLALGFPRRALLSVLRPKKQGKRKEQRRGMTSEATRQREERNNGSRFIVERACSWASPRSSW
jgi:hypothetical protein